METIPWGGFNLNKYSFPPTSPHHHHIHTHDSCTEKNPVRFVPAADVSLLLPVWVDWTPHFLPQRLERLSLSQE